jgi:molybdenum-dependent DNA-binding transcriptional regulator ModE
MYNKKEMIEKKLVMAAKILESDEYKKADALLKKVNKLKEEVKEYCQKNEMKEMVVVEDNLKYKVDYKVRTARRADPQLLSPEILDEITVNVESWLQFYTIE